jgi:hypothetical protein
MKIFNRGIDIKVKDESALKVNGVEVLTKDGAIVGDIQATAGSIGTTELAANAVTGAKLSVVSRNKPCMVVGGTITTTGASDTYLIAPEAGSLESIEINPLVALAANNSNYITFTVTNLGQAGAGNTAMLTADDTNTTKATGGIGLAINTKRALTVHGTAANLVVAKGDKLKITATATGTLANTVTVPVYMARFSVTA